MSIDRKSFLRISGCALAGVLAGGKLGDMVAEAQDGSMEPDPRELTAKRWGMLIDTRKCLQGGCTKCIEACHSIHNVPDIPDKKHEVKWIWKEPVEHAFPSLDTEYPDEKLKNRPALLLCNHCEKPPCVRVCPTQATWKRKSDGIVMMDWHRCIGCRYCMAACPYGSRSFNWVDPRPYIKKLNPDFPTRTKGVVEKCNFCEERLAIGQMPACVEACPEKALVFGDLLDPNSEVRQLLRSGYTHRRKPELGTKPDIFYIL